MLAPMTTASCMNVTENQKVCSNTESKGPVKIHPEHCSPNSYFGSKVFFASNMVVAGEGRWATF